MFAVAVVLILMMKLWKGGRNEGIISFMSLSQKDEGVKCMVRVTWWWEGTIEFWEEVWPHHFSHWHAAFSKGHKDRAL